MYVYIRFIILFSFFSFCLIITIKKSCRLRSLDLDHGLATFTSMSGRHTMLLQRTRNERKWRKNNRLISRRPVVCVCVCERREKFTRYVNIRSTFAYETKSSRWPIIEQIQRLVSRRRHGRPEKGRFVELKNPTDRNVKKRRQLLYFLQAYLTRVS